MLTPYETDRQFRKEVLWRACSQMRGVKDPIAYMNKQVKKYGEIYRDVFAAMYEVYHLNCIAVAEDKADQAVCAKFGWTSISQWRDQEMAEIADIRAKGEF